CGCCSSPSSSSFASSARMVDGRHGRLACSASHFEPTGWPCETCVSTTFLSTSACRWVSSMDLLCFRPGRASGGAVRLELGFRVLDDLVAALLGHGVDDQTAVVAHLLHGAAHRDLLLGEAHAAELHGQALERAEVAAGGHHVRARDERHAVEA